MATSTQSRESRSEEELALVVEREFRRCRSDPLYFIVTYVWIRHPSKGRINFELYDYQRKVLAHWQKHRHSLILKARQIGCSTLISAYVLWFALFQADRNILLLSKTEEDAKKLLAKAILAYKSIPQWLKFRASEVEGTEALASNNVERMTFTNGSIIDSLPATKDTGRGESASLVVLDEWAFLPDPEATWAAVEPTADIGGRIIALSTAKGWGNLFHQQWELAEQKKGMFRNLFFSWEATPERGEDWYQSKVESLPEWQLHQEYPRNAEEAFIRSGNPYFNVDIIRTWVPARRERKTFQIREDSSYFVNWDRGELAIWKEPEPDAAYVLGVDTAEGLEKGDYSSIHVLRYGTGEVVACWHGRIDPDLLGKLVVCRLGAYYNWALAGIERNSSGLTTVSAVINAEYPNVYFQTELDSVTKTPRKKFGWKTTRTTKPLMLDELEEAIREGTIECWDEGTKHELLAFQRGPDGRGEGSPHDDRVISLAIAVQMLKVAWQPEFVPRRDLPKFSDEWFEARTISHKKYLDVIGNEGLVA